MIQVISFSEAGCTGRRRMLHISGECILGYDPARNIQINDRYSIRIGGNQLRYYETLTDDKKINYLSKMVTKKREGE